MSVSDNEDLDTKPSAASQQQPQPTETPPARRNQKRGLNYSENVGLVDSSRGGGGRHTVQNISLSHEQQVEISYRRAAMLLRGGAANEDGDSYNNKNEKEIVIMPSLVSLSDDFFKISNSDDSGSDESSEGAPEMLPDLPATNLNNNNSSGVVPRLRPRLRGGSENECGNNNNNSGDVTMTTTTNAARLRDGWPIGPHGAQVPSYLLDRINHDNNDGSASGDGSSPQVHSLVASAAAARMTPPRPPPVATTPTTTGRNLQDSPQRSAARRVREIMKQSEEQQLLQQQQRQSQHFINITLSLEWAVTRLEETLRQRDENDTDNGVVGGGSRGLVGNGGYAQTSVEEMESNTLTQLAEIMLHPPTHIVSGRYCWKDEDNHSKNNYKEDSGSDGKGEDEWGRMRMTTSPLPLAKMYIGEKNNNNSYYDDKEGVSQVNNRNCKENDDDEDVIMTPEDDSMSKKEQTPSLLLPTITSLLHKKSRYPTLHSAELSISSLGKSCPTRRVCQHPFRRNDIVWVCRTCQSDETCVLCHDCFSHSNHEGHDVAFYHAQAGGCCDCGDADAWDPKGFCNKHGGQNGHGGAPSGTEVAKAEPAVLGSVHACADWLVDVVQSGVEGGYRRANPLPIVSPDGSNRRSSSAGMLAKTDSALPESYEEPELGRVRERERSLRRDRSLARRNSVADMETLTFGATEDEGSSRASNSMRRSNSIMSIEANSSLEAVSSDLDDSGNEGFGPSRLPIPILHEVQFDPVAASSSRRRDESSNNATTATATKRDTDICINENVFDPTAASTSKSSSHQRATKKARAPPKSPAQALGDLGREECGLFLVVHSDDIRIGAHSPVEAINALKDFFSKSVSTPDVAASDLDISGGDFSFPGTAGLFSRGMVGDTRPNHVRILPGIGRFRSSHLDAIIDKIIRIIKTHGEMIVWGTQELLAECGDVTARCWRDGDPNSSALIGASMLNRAKILTDGGLVCSIKTRKEVVNEQTATSVIKLINHVAQSCDPLCDQVSSGISGRGISSTLPPLLRNDLKLPYKLVSSWHALLLTLLAVPNFKASLANAYCDSYLSVTSEYARGVGVLERSSYTLSVQFLNRISYVTELVRERSLINNLFFCLNEIMSLALVRETPTLLADSRDFDDISTSNLIAAALALLGHSSLVGADEESLLRLFDDELSDIMNRKGGDSRHHGRVSTRGLTREQNKNLIRRSTLLNPKLDPTHDTLAHRRYSVCISDLKCVLNVDGMARHFASLPCNGGEDAPCALNAWIKTLSLAQNMDGVCWKDYSQAHIERDNSAWVGAFNASISLGSLYERLLKWEDTDPSPIDDCVIPVRLLSCAELCYYTLTKGVDRWQRGEILSCHPSPAPFAMKVGHALKSASLPFSTVSSAHGTPLAMTALPLSQLEPFSFHLPLHRFVASCLRELSRRKDDNGGLLELIGKFQINSITSDEGKEKLLRKNDLLFRGMMEFPIIVLSRAAQIRAGIWKRNGPGMSDMVLNYSEPPFCRNLQDADIFLVQFALVCIATLTEGDNKVKMEGPSSFNGAGTARLVNLLIHRFGVFSFLGLEMAPPTDVDRYIEEVQKGMYPAEIKPIDQRGERSSTPAMPWVYTPARDSSHEMLLLGELLHLFIALISELPPPPAEDKAQHAIEARRRLMREVIHRLVSGPKTHSEMTEVHHILSNRDTDVLCDLGKKINPDDASGAALEEALNEVGTRKCKSGAPDEWELKESAWKDYDPSFQHISTRAHQHASERRPKQKAEAPCLPYAPRPLPAHILFCRLRRDLTADSTLLACIYRVLHVHCHRPWMVLKEYPGKSMYEAHIKSETVLARAIHLLTLGVFAWEEDPSSGSNDLNNWRCHGGGGIASVFENFDRPPTASDWVEKALLRAPNEIMQCSEYNDEENVLFLLRQVALETQSREQDLSGFLGGLDQSLKSGAMFLCNFAAKVNPQASSIVAEYFTVRRAVNDGAEDLEKRKMAAKEKALAAMKAQMAKFAANLGDDNEDDRMSDADGADSSISTNRDDSRILTTPVRQRSNSIGLESMDLSPHGDFLLTPSSVRTPLTPSSPRDDGENESARLFAELPRCIICGDDEKIHCNNNLVSSTLFPKKEKRTLAFCGYSQASTVLKGVSGEPPVRDTENNIWRHVGVHISLCGHAIHKACCDTYLKTSQRDRLTDRLEGGKRREFRCPLCQRMSNCLVPFVDVAADWLDFPSMNSKADASRVSAINDMVGDGSSCNDGGKSMSLHDFLSISVWWATRNDDYVWDGHCNFAKASGGEQKKLLPYGNANPRATLPKRKNPLKKMTDGKKELINAWNQVLRTPRRLQHQTRHSAFALTTPGSIGQKDSNNTDILRKFMDQVVDVGQRADLKRLGEEELAKDYGEFRHYLTERAICNDLNRAAGKEVLDWPMCLTSSPMSEDRTQRLSKEKLVSKLLYCIQSFTYSCCSEASDLRRLLRGKTNDTSPIYSRFGLGNSLLQHNVLLLPRAELSVDGGFQPFDGRLGKIRYLGLVLMAAASPVSKEIVQLCMSFPCSPLSFQSASIFDFDAEDDSMTVQRAPVAYPLLRSHVLTHTTGALIAVAGSARADDGNYNINNVVEDCLKFISLGLIARIVQVLLSGLTPWREEQIDFVVRSIREEMVDDTEPEECSWRQSCFDLLRTIFGREDDDALNIEASQDVAANLIASQISMGIDAAKEEAVDFLLDIVVIVQILVPNIFSDTTMHQNVCGGSNPSEVEMMKSLIKLIQLESIHDMIQSSLVQQIIKSWYTEATDKTESQLECSRDINCVTWPVVPRSRRSCTLDEFPPNCSPLLGYSTSTSPFNAPSCRIICLPKSYTDLYAQLSALCPDCDQMGLCLICGSVLNAGGKAQCTKHASKCGGGVGIFFLVQECVGLIMHGTKAAYVPSLYVDSHGETPQFRGRPLNLDPLRWNLLQDTWCSHSVREKVISERSISRQVIIANYY